MINYLEDAWSAIPGWTATTTAVKAARQARLRVASPLAMYDVQAEATRALLAGEPVDDLLEDVAAATIGEQHAERTRGLLETVAVDLEQARDEMQHRQADAALTRLASHLTTLLAEARGLTEALRGVTTADDAIAAGAKAIHAWSKATALADRYTALRRTQATLTTWGYGGVGVTGDPSAAFAARQDIETAGAHTGDEPLPASPVAQLLALAENGNAWVPTTAQLKARAAEIRDQHAHLTGSGPGPYRSGDVDGSESADVAAEVVGGWR